MRTIAWFKVDDGFWSHPKVITLSDEAVALWVRAGTYSCQHLTDGVIKKALLRFLGSADGAEELVDCGLWVTHEEGYQFHDWDEYQESSDDVKRRRDLARERQRKRRAVRDNPRESQVSAHSGIKSGHANVTRDTPRDSQSSSQEVSTPDPTRPDPTRPLKDKESAHAQEQSEPPKPRSKPRTRIPDGWHPTDAHIAYCNERGIELDTEAIAFVAHAEANDRTLANWNSGFTQWLTKARPRQQGNGYGNRPQNQQQAPRRETAEEMYNRLNGPQMPPQPTQNYAQGHQVIDVDTDQQLAIPATQGYTGRAPGTGVPLPRFNR